MSAYITYLKETGMVIGNGSTSHPEKLHEEEDDEYGHLLVETLPAEPTKVVDGVLVLAEPADYIQMTEEAARSEIQNKVWSELNQTDWTQYKDAPVDKVMWAKYRQALREIDVDVGEVFSIVMPERPSSDTLQNQRLQAIGKINTLIGVKRTEYATDIPFQDEIYAEKKIEAVSYLSQTPEPTSLTNYPWIADAVGIDGSTPLEVAQLWAGLQSEWILLARATEKLRRQAIVSVEESSTSNEIKAAIALLKSALRENY